MNPPDERRSAREAEIVEAERALARGQYQAARKHLSEAARLGAPQHELMGLQRAVETREAGRNKSARKARWIGFALGALAYLLLSIRQPPAWTIPVWAALAFLLVPGVVGLVTGRMLGPELEAGTRFRAGMAAGGWAMFWYAAITLIYLRVRVGPGGDLGQVLFAILFITILYALLAGIVAGIVSAKLAWRSAGRGTA